MTANDIILALIEEQIFLRESVRRAGDSADIVYFGEEIGKLQIAMSLIKTYAENNNRLQK